MGPAEGWMAIPIPTPPPPPPLFHQFLNLRYVGEIGPQKYVHLRKIICIFCFSRNSNLISGPFYGLECVRVGAAAPVAFGLGHKSDPAGRR